MGLDMYLRASKYIGGWNHSSEEEKTQYAKIVEVAGLKDWRCEGSPSANIEVTVAYWRKSNQIHAWFVEHCQEGEDDCDIYYVERKQLEELKALCERILVSKDPTDLPPQAGFPFGSTEIDHYYWQDLKETVSQLNVILENPAFEHWTFNYHSIW